VIVVPTHACSANDGRLPASDVYGELDRDNVATCILRVRWGSGERGPGCGARIALCHGCGLRTRVNGAPCGTCGGEERPEVMRHDDCGAHGTQAASGVSTGPVPVAANVGDAGLQGMGARVEAGPRQQQSDAGPRRETKATAQSKPRAPRKSVKKGAAAPDGPELPLFK
jgi:hypothetical protein